MSDRPRVSVIVPFINSETHLAACIDALLGQKGLGDSFEIVLVDNGSQDGSRSIAERYPDVILLDEATPGAYAARNAGIREARAPLLAFTDADCVVADDWLRSLDNALADPAVAMVVGQCRYPSRASLPLRTLAAYENAKAEYVIQRSAKAHHFAYANNMGVRASVFAELGPFREWKRAGDTELVHRLAASRPDLRLSYCDAMKVTHLEFLRARDRARRLSLYTKTNAKIESFRELGLVDRLGVLAHWTRRRVGLSGGVS